jgi:protein O-GlcNAc transferase
MPQGQDIKTGQSIASGFVRPKSHLPKALADAKSALRAGDVQRASDLLDSPTLEFVKENADRNPLGRGLLLELTSVLSGTGREAEAEQCYEKMLDSGPDALAFDRLGALCLSMGRITEAVRYQRKALQIEPERPELQANLARALMEAGCMQEGIDLLRKAVEKAPSNAQAHSNLLFRLHQLPTIEPQVIFDRHKRWAALHAPPRLAAKSHANTPDPERRLKVGYLSPDFRRHSVAYFFEALLDGHDRSEVELYGYGSIEFPDEVTERLSRKFDCCRNVWDLTDDALAVLIQRDRIDILVDLAGHVGRSRLLVLARKPAPIQVTYLGYPDTTGIQAVDYRLTDALADPPGSQRFHTEQLVNLPQGFVCYRPPEFAPSIAPLPAAGKGYVTFASFNSGSKINPVIGRIWSQVLEANPAWRLLLKVKAGLEPQVRDGYLGRFQQWGVSPERIDICGWKSPDEHLRMYNQVDIALDTYPYSGTTTTCEALWMGVPVISLVGQSHCSRAGLSILTRVGLEFFAAATPQEYVAKATSLAANLPALGRIRTSMRARIAASGLCYAKGFAHGVEAAYREMWRRWCRSRSNRLAEGRHRTGGIL